MTNPLISIVVPCYNQAQFLDECLQSVIDQTYQNWECIIVNDGSTDNSSIIAKNWAEKDSRFIYIHKENGGVSSARNFGIERANGEWILPLDGDDKIGNKYLTLAHENFANDYKIIYCKAELFGEENSHWQLQQYSYEKMLTKNHIFCSSFYRKKEWQRCGGYDEDFVHGQEDWDYWLSILTPADKVLQLNYIGFYYRRKKISRDVLFNNDLQKQEFTERQIYIKHLDKYLVFNHNPLKNFYLQEIQNKKLQALKKEINKNLLTKILYKIIEKI